MRKPADAISAYLRAKDGNRPHLLAHAFAEHAVLTMDVRTGTIAFPPVSRGRDAIADVLVRRFTQAYENVYTLCLGPAPMHFVNVFRCDWLVAMTEKEGRGVRVGCGRYDWRFAPVSGLVDSLMITIEVMQALPADAQADVMAWVANLPSRWCSAQFALQGMPHRDELAPVLDYFSAAVV